MRDLPRLWLLVERGVDASTIFRIEVPVPCQLSGQDQECMVGRRSYDIAHAVQRSALGKECLKFAGWKIPRSRLNEINLDDRAITKQNPFSFEFEESLVSQFRNDRRHIGWMNKKIDVAPPWGKRTEDENALLDDRVDGSEYRYGV
jgi:hypothetical protein